ncbi:hypothetical protein LCGC14_2259180 [marine sediment metagenome]|uniref:Uncharacterized protein n=1 Tax=marine sediment metagenome TaxID=412755 RepID=A0A0F9D078_9ZZZZ
MIDAELMYYAGGTLLAIYLVVTAGFFSALWSMPAGTHTLRAMLIKLAAAACWPYVVYQALREAGE